MTAILEQPQAEAAGIAEAVPLFDRVGGARLIELLVDRFVEKSRSDPELAPVWTRVDLSSFKKAQVAFFTQALGGSFPDGDVASHRAHVQLDAEQFIRVVLLLQSALSSLGLSDDLHEELVRAVVKAALTAGAK